MDFREPEAGSCGSVDPRRPKAISRALHDRVTFATAVRHVAMLHAVPLLAPRLVMGRTSASDANVSVVGSLPVLRHEAAFWHRGQRCKAQGTGADRLRPRPCCLPG